MSKPDPRKQLEDMEMRKALYRLIWEMSHPAKPHPQGVIPAQPCPSLSDEEIQDELRRILGIKKGLFG